MSDTRPARRVRKRRGSSRARDREALDLHVKGWTYEEIAAHLGLCDRSGAYVAVQRALEERSAEYESQTLPLAKAVAMSRLDQLLSSWWPQATGQNTIGVPDDKAAGIVLRIMERQAKIIGYEAAQQVDITGQVHLTLEAARAEAMRRMDELAARESATVRALPTAG